MKTKSLFIVALLSLFSLSAFAEGDTTYVEIDYPTDSIFFQGDTVNFSLVSTNSAMITEKVIVRILTAGWGTTDQAMTLNVPITLPFDTFLVVPEDTKMKDCPEVGDNAFSLMMQVGVDGGWNNNPEQLVVAKKDGQDCPVVVMPMTDIFNVEMKILRVEGDTITRGMANWIGWGTNPRPGDILWVTGSYEPVVGESTATEVYINISYFFSDWSGSLTLQRFQYASTAKGNLDGNIDMRMVVGYYHADSLLADVGGDTDYNELAQVRVVYDNPITYEAMNGNVVEGTPYMNWWGPLNKYTGDMPTIGANVSGAEVVEVGDTSVELKWDLAADATWDVVIGEKGSIRNPDTEEFVTVGGINSTFAGLQPGTDYELFIRSVSNPDTTNASANRTVGAYNTDNAIEFTTTGTAALFQAQVNDNVSIFPNPTSGKLTITSDATYQIEVLDLSGRMVVSTSMASQTQELDLSDMKNGMYLIRFSNESKSFAKTFIKQ